MTIEHEPFPPYTLDYSTMPPSCLPTYLNINILVGITTIEDSWCRYMDVQTGKIYDGVEFWAKVQRHKEANHE